MKMLLGEGLDTGVNLGVSKRKREWHSLQEWESMTPLRVI
jgi:hypothetical protein